MADEPTPDGDRIAQLSDDQLIEVVEQFEQMLNDGKDTDEAGELIATKYGLTRDDVHQIVREARAGEDDEIDPDPDGGKPA